MNQRCAWCNTVYGTKESASVQQTSHGACAACKEQFLEKLRQSDLARDAAAPQHTSQPDGKVKVRRQSS